MDQVESLANELHVWLQTTFPLAKERGIGIRDSLLDSGIIDSLGTLEVVNYLEQDLGVTVSDEEMVADTFESVHAIAQFVVSKRSQTVNSGDDN
tara:strand:- start:105 stop:386 length:282 start_codon:yes stop_codon:yes gene_type:complete